MVLIVILALTVNVTLFPGQPVSAEEGGLPDLTITTGNPVITPPAVAPGEAFTLSSWTVRNQGDADSGYVLSGIYLSVNSVITSGDTLIATRNNPSLAPGAERVWPISDITIPSSVPAGNYYIGILVDRTSQIVESNEYNNYVSSPISIVVDNSPPEITVTEPADGLITNQDVTLSYTVTDDVSAPEDITVTGPVSGTTYTTEGEYDITITATDEKDNTASVSVSFTIDKTPPEVIITYPTEGMEFRPEDTLDVEYTVTDAVDPSPSVTVSPSDPVISPLPEGELTITVTATDSSGNTGTASVTVSVIPSAIPVSIDFTPETLNINSKGNWVSVYIEMPEGYDVSGIDGATVLLNNTIPAYLGKQGWAERYANDANIYDVDEDGIPERLVKFDRDAVAGIIEAGNEVTITVSGLCDGCPFEGTALIRVIDKDGKKNK